MKYIVGTKIGMVKLFDVNGKAYPGTVVHCEPNVVLENKTTEKNGKNGIKIGYKEINENKVNKCHKGIFSKVNAKVCKHIKTFSNAENYNVGDKINVETFQPGEYVDVQGITKGHGFTGAIKRWNFKIGPLSHGAGYPHRYQGSIAMGRGGSQAQRVPKGKKMHGHYGHELVTIQNQFVLKVMPEDNLIIISGAIPGPKGSVVTIKTAVKNPTKTQPVDLITFKNVDIIEDKNIELENKEVAYEINKETEEAIKDQEEFVNEAKEQKLAEQHHEKLIEEEKKIIEGNNQ